MVSTEAMLLISDSLSLAEDSIVSAEVEGRSVEDLETGLEILFTKQMSESVNFSLILNHLAALGLFGLHKTSIPSQSS